MGVGGITGLERLNHPSWVGLDRFERDLMYALSDPGHEAKLRNIRVQTVLTDLMNTDPYLKEKDPEEVIDAMNEIMEINPDLHKNKPMLRLALRQFLESGGMDIPTLGVLSEFGKEERERKSREREQAASTAAQHASQLQSELDNKRRLESEERRAREENETKLQISKQEIESREKLEKAKLKHEKIMEKLRHPEPEKPKKRLPRRIADALKDTATAVDMIKHPGQAIAHWWKNGLNDTNEHFESDEVRGTTVPEPDRAINDKGQVVDKDGNIITINNEGKLEAVSPHEYNVRQNMQQAVQEVQEREEKLDEELSTFAPNIKARNIETKRELGPSEARRRRKNSPDKLRETILESVLQEQDEATREAIRSSGKIPDEIRKEVGKRLAEQMTDTQPMTKEEYIQHKRTAKEDSQKVLDNELKNLPETLPDTLPLAMEINPSGNTTDWTDFTDEVLDAAEQTEARLKQQQPENIQSEQQPTPEVIAREQELNKRIGYTPAPPSTTRTRSSTPFFGQPSPQNNPRNTRQKQKRPKGKQTSENIFNGINSSLNEDLGESNWDEVPLGSQSSPNGYQAQQEAWNAELQRQQEEAAKQQADWERNQAELQRQQDEAKQWYNDFIQEQNDTLSTVPKGSPNYYRAKARIQHGDWWHANHPEGVDYVKLKDSFLHPKATFGGSGGGLGRAMNYLAQQDRNKNKKKRR